jgi:tRNA pseudouridine55 synthase
MDGILPLWKEKGMTSHDCVFKLRKILKTKKIGHGGTLDPDVEGVLPIAIGRATKVVEFMIESNKVYEGAITLGISTTTEDASGEVVDSKDVPSSLSTEEIDKAMEKLTGSIIQVPPMYSAVRVNGKRLYEYARANETVERPERNVTIHSFERTTEPVYDENRQTMSWRFKVVCSKGTYVRTLSVDTGKVLGYPAHMSELTRTQSGGLFAKETLTLKEVEEAMEIGKIESYLKPLDAGLTLFDKKELTDDEWQKVQNGALLPKKDFAKVSFPVVFTYKGHAVALYDAHPKKDNMIKPKKVFLTELKV